MNEAQPHRGRDWIVALVLIVTTFVTYGRVAGHGFVNYDDTLYVYENEAVQAGLSVEGVRWAFTSNVASNWHPLTWLSHMLDCQLFGLDAGKHHLMSVFLHALNAVLLFAFLRYATRSFWPCVLVAALFALHPLRVESVAWASERKDVLSGMFWFLTMIAYVGYTRAPSVGRYAVVFVALALGLLAKPMLVTLPCVLLLLDLWPLGRLEVMGWRKLVVEKLPLFGLVVASSVVTAIVQARGGAATSADALPLLERLANASVAYATYLGKSVWPTGLTVFYPHPTTAYDTIPTSLRVLAAVAALGLVALTAWVALGWRRRPQLVTGWLWFVGTLVPVIGLFQVGNQAWADRYAYLPLVGAYIAVVWGVSQALDGREVWRKRAWLFGALATVAFAATAFVQVGHWRDSESLYQHALDVTERNYVAHHNLGIAYLEAERFDDARTHFEATVRARRGHAKALTNLGVLAARDRDITRARQYFEAALENEPDHLEAHFNLGLLLARANDTDGAIRHFVATTRIDPTHARAHYSLGILLRANGKHDQAIARYRLALTHQPDYPEAANNLARLLATAPDATLRNGSEALALARAIVAATDRGNPVFLATLAATLAETRDFENAARVQSEAIALAPPANRPAFEPALSLYRAGKPLRER